MDQLEAAAKDRLTPFDDAASRALTTEEAALPFSTRVLERALFRLSRH